VEKWHQQLQICEATKNIDISPTNVGNDPTELKMIAKDHDASISDTAEHGNQKVHIRFHQIQIEDSRKKVHNINNTDFLKSADLTPSVFTQFCSSSS